MKSFFLTQDKHHNPRKSYRFHSAAIWIRIIFYEQKLRTRYVISQQQLLAVAKEIVFIKDSKTTNWQKNVHHFWTEGCALHTIISSIFFGIYIDRTRLNLFCGKKRVLWTQKYMTKKTQCGRSNESLIDTKIYSIW